MLRRIRILVKERGNFTITGQNSRTVQVTLPKIIHYIADSNDLDVFSGKMKIISKSKGKLVFREVKCYICYKLLQPGDVGVNCPHCSMTFHRNHWEAWVQNRHRCPYCRHQV